MTKKQKQKIHSVVQTTLKIIGCSSLFIGMTVALGKSNPDMEIFAYLSMIFGTLLIIIHSCRDNDHMYLLVSSAGFLLIGNAFLGTETALMLMPELAMAEDQGWFAKYGKVIVEVLRTVIK